MPLAQLVNSIPALSQTSDDEIDRAPEDIVKAGRATKRIIVPVPLAGPQLGAGVALGAVWFYTPGAASRP